MRWVLQTRFLWVESENVSILTFCCLNLFTPPTLFLLRFSQDSNVCLPLSSPKNSPLTQYHTPTARAPQSNTRSFCPPFFPPPHPNTPLSHMSFSNTCPCYWPEHQTLKLHNLLHSLPSFCYPYSFSSFLLCWPIFAPLIRQYYWSHLLHFSHPCSS